MGRHLTTQAEHRECGRIAIVTGASRGIANAIACFLTGYGWLIIEFDRQWSGDADNHFAKRPIVDVSDFDAVKVAVDGIEVDGLTIACVVKNTGITRDCVTKRISSKMR